MKVKLLKKLRKRFFWYMDGQSHWYYYDKKTNETNYAFIIGVSRINDALILSMLSKIGLEHLYEPRFKKIARIKKEKQEQKRKLYFSKFFKS